MGLVYAPSLPLHIDANILIHLSNQRLAAETISTIVSGLEFGQLAISVMALAEFRVGAFEIALPEQTLIERMRVISFQPDLIPRVVLMRREYRLKLPDAVIAATALQAGAQLLTSDADFLRVEGLHVLVPELVN